MTIFNIADFMTTTSKISDTVAQLRWSCRRGMLELDLLLGQFLERRYSALTAEEQALFKALLDSTDQDLYAWLVARLPATEPRFEGLLQKIREYVPC